LGTTSCGTLITRVDPGNRRVLHSGPYGGTVYDLRTAICYFYEEPSYMLREGDMDLLGPLKVPLLIVDIPLSFVADSLILPATVFENCGGHNHIIASTHCEYGE
jgi:uncharacterized protein YceK